MKGLGASRSSPRDVTFGSKTSLGPFSVSPAWRPWTRSSGVVGSFSMPALPAQRLRTALSADSSPESILFGPLRPRSRALAGSAGQPGLAGQRAGQGLPPGAGSAIDGGFRWSSFPNRCSRQDRRSRNVFRSHPPFRLPRRRPFFRLRRPRRCARASAQR